MSDLNARHNRAVWFDIPVSDLGRARAFYESVLALPVHEEQFEQLRSCVLDHDQGNGGCLVPGEVAPSGGVLLYLNVNGRIRDAVQKVPAHGGEVVEDVHPIGPHGFRSIVRDSEGNRIALHSETDA